MKMTIGACSVLVCMATTTFGSAGCSAPPVHEDTGESSAALSTTTFDVDFTDCHDYAGLAPVPTKNVASYVPAPYTIAEPAPGTANVVVRSVWCRTSSIDPKPSVVTQIGVNIVSPDGTGDINNFTVFYLTTSHALAAGLRRAGVPADVDEDLVFRWTSTDATHAHLVVSNDDDVQPPFVIDSIVGAPGTFPVDFVANWYVAHGKHQEEMHSTYPGILFGGNSPTVTVHTPRHSGLGKMLGSDTGTFTSLSVFNAIPSSHMHVSSL